MKPRGVFGDDTVAAAMIDRLVHHTEVISLKGGGYRMRGRDIGRIPPADPGKCNDRPWVSSRSGARTKLQVRYLRFAGVRSVRDSGVREGEAVKPVREPSPDGASARSHETKPHRSAPAGHRRDLGRACAHDRVRLRTQFVLLRCPRDAGFAIAPMHTGGEP
ncbi:ATP-binding protein [Streptomyces sp. 2231.1]|uniref:ATP-binding protein n=1 Tax=Streptomyces sp. 2231.1 TaxID=1855347 RepID=UPI000B895F9B|nr:ATP-binding protein [Streptomyces sp. 2231.1]